jgi:hypothetical protein
MLTILTDTHDTLKEDCLLVRDSCNLLTLNNPLMITRNFITLKLSSRRYITFYRLIYVEAL